MKTLQVLTYNNYYNRILKRGMKLTDYADFVVYQLNQTNFNPNDGVTTEHIVGSGDFNGVGNYVLIVDGNEIVSRWFIIESIRTRSGQYKLILLRDLLADYYDIIIDSPIFIEKAIPQFNSPFIFSKENMSYNQIKKGEWLLKDKTKCPWLVGYYSKKISGDNALSGALPQISDTIIATGVNSLDEWDLYNYTTSSPTQEIFYAPTQEYTLILHFNVRDYTNSQFEIRLFHPSNGVASESWTTSDRGNKTFLSLTETRDKVYEAMISENYGNWNYQSEGAWGSDVLYDQLINLDGKIISFENGSVYSVKLENLGTKIKYTSILPNANVGEHINSALSAIPGIVVQPNDNTYAIESTSQAYRIVLTPRLDLAYTYDLTNGRACKDEVYDMFAIPYGELAFNYDAQDYIVNNNQLAMKLAREIQRKGGSNIYDVQLLPFCPATDLILSDGTLIGDASSMQLIKQPNTEIVDMVIVFPNAATFSVDELIIENSQTSTLSWSEALHYSNTIEKKVVSECDEIRLVSPNYNGQFSYNIAKNGGSQGFTADCTYKPYSPYIHVNPIFGGLYGQDFNDARGLICQGDFSLSAITDAWVQYEINNKNYNNIFNREIQSMELNNSISQTKDVIGAITGTITSIAGGAIAGAQSGNVVGGAITGGVAGAVGGALDVYYNQVIRQESMDLKKDLYGYQLGNIKALPYSLSKVTALNNNNKLFPFLEYYSCTDQEKQALREKIKYNGMTIMAIGKMSEYINNTTELQYFKGRLIRFADMTEDYHIVNAIKDELEKGVFIKWEYNQI